MLEKTLESPLDCKEIRPVNSKGNQSSVFTGRIDAGELVMDSEAWRAAVHAFAKSQTGPSD